jgi:hypothetical protein
MSVELQLQTVIRHVGGPDELRPAVSLLATRASRQAVHTAVEQLIPHLGTLIAIPAAAHEANLKALLRRDFAHLEDSDLPLEPADERVLLRVVRQARDEAGASNAEVFSLSYELQAT